MLLASWLVAGALEARELSDAEIDQLETLSRLGTEACDQGNYESCHRLFLEAQQLLPWAPHQFYVAEALVGMGRLLEGLQLWQQIVDTNLDPDDPEVRKFVAAANKRLTQERPHVPQLTLEIDPAHTEGLEVRLDGRRLRPDERFEPLAVDPGAHVLELSQFGYVKELHNLQLARGEHRVIRISLVSLSEQEPGPKPDSSDSDPSTQWRMPLGIGFMLVGAGSLVAGAVTYGLKEDRREALLQDCGNVSPCDGLTPAEFADRKARVEDRTFVSNLLLFGGAGLAVGGAGLLLWEGFSGGSGAEATAAARGGAARVRLSAQADAAGYWFGFDGRY